MTGKHITPEQKTRALTLRSAGYTLTVIADKTDMSVSTLKRLLKTHLVKKGGLKKSVIRRATDQLIHDATTIETIKREAASLLLDDLAIVKRLRVAIAEATEVLSSTNTSEALQVMRAASAGAVALKSTSETAHKSLGLDKEKDPDSALPELVIRVLTESEIEEIHDQRTNMSMEFEKEIITNLSNDNVEGVIIGGLDKLETTSAWTPK
jgi:hypothetical protein